MKTIHNSKSVRLYGPYPDKTDASKCTVHIWLSGASQARVVPIIGFDLTPLHEFLSRELLGRLVDRAVAQGRGDAPPEPTPDTYDDIDDGE